MSTAQLSFLVSRRAQILSSSVILRFFMWLAQSDRVFLGNVLFLAVFLASLV